MEGVVEGDKLILAAIGLQRLSDLARKLDSSLIGLGAAVANKGLGCAGKATGRVRKLDQLLREETSVRIVVEVRGMHELLSLEAG